jgi:lipopolysaccharide export system protein LptA
MRTVLTTIALFVALFAQAQKPTQVELLNADYLQVDDRLGKDVKRLVGNVAFKHDDVLMYCDSAYLYTLTNSLDAFSQVHIIQGDSVNMYGDKLKYDGNKKQAVMTGNVLLVDNNNTVTTDKLNYDVKNGIATYNTGGKIVSRQNNNVLTSKIGYYYSKSKQFYFRKQVVLVNPQYTVNSDTLRYNTVNETSYFFGPTTIVSKENFIYCENGWYDTKRDLAQFSRNAYIISGKQKLNGDSLFYDRKKGLGKGFGNVVLADTTQNLVIKGDKGFYEEDREKMIVFGNAEMAQLFDTDTLFLHADTLRSEYDSCKEYRQLFAHYKVKFFKADMQGKCDSLVFSYADSILKMFHKPVLWTDENQLTARYIEIRTSGGKIQRLDMYDVAFVISKEDSLYYNQIKGKKIVGHFVANELRKINVYGNGQTIYYPKDKNQYTGVNRADCTDMVIYTEKKAVEKITFITKPAATLYPMDELPPKELLLKDFNWRAKERPLKREDIFVE